MLPDRIDPVWVEGAIIEVRGQEPAKQELVALVGTYILKGRCSEPKRCLELISKLNKNEMLH